MEDKDTRIAGLKSQVFGLEKMLGVTMKRYKAALKVVEAANNLRFWCRSSHGHEPAGYKEFQDALSDYTAASQGEDKP